MWNQVNIKPKACSASFIYRGTFSDIQWRVRGQDTRISEAKPWPLQVRTPSRRKGEGLEERDWCWRAETGRSTGVSCQEATAWKSFKESETAGGTHRRAGSHKRCMHRLWVSQAEMNIVENMTAEDEDDEGDSGDGSCWYLLSPQRRKSHCVYINSFNPTTHGRVDTLISILQMRQLGTKGWCENTDNKQKVKSVAAMWHDWQGHIQCHQKTRSI